MGNINSINKINFEEMIKAIENNDIIKISTLEINNQNCLIKGTLNPEEEIKELNINLKNAKNKRVIIYGINCNDIKIEKKYIQIKSLGYVNTSIYLGGMFEWLLLQEVYGNEMFPTTSQELDILRYVI